MTSARHGGGLDAGEVIARALGVVRARIAAAAARAGRDPSAVLLLGATKTVTAEEILAAARAGLSAVGENRAQDLVAKQAALAVHSEAAELRWDFIGAVQRNKINKVVGRVTLIHGIDSIELADAVGRRAAGMGRVQDVLLEVNTSAETTKHGFSPEKVFAAADGVQAIEGLDLRGLMTMAAPGDRGRARSCFAALAAIVADARWGGGRELSMGMSDDFEVAVEEGATIVRVGTAIFGARCEAGLGA